MVKIRANQVDSQGTRGAQHENKIRSQRESKLTALSKLATSRALASDKNILAHFPLLKFNLPTFAGGYNK